METSDSFGNETIHSGQFMISKYDEDSDVEEETTVSNKSQKLESTRESTGGVVSFSFMDTGDFSFGDAKLTIDESLQKMFQFLSIAMSGKITNPKWNSFKGVKFASKDKIRLNNVIWREYHMQFVKKLRPVVVQFASPLSESPQVHGNVVLEGKFWKRRENIIVYQYKQWRKYFKHRSLLCQCCYTKQPQDISSVILERINASGSSSTSIIPVSVGMAYSAECASSNANTTSSNQRNQQNSSPYDWLMDLDDKFFNGPPSIIGQSNSITSNNDIGLDNAAQFLLDSGGMFTKSSAASSSNSSGEYCQLASSSCCPVVQPQLTNLQPMMDTNWEFFGRDFTMPAELVQDFTSQLQSKTSNTNHQRLHSSESSLQKDPATEMTHVTSHPLSTVFTKPSTYTQFHTRNKVKLPSSHSSNVTPTNNKICSSSSNVNKNKSPSNQQLCKTPNLLSILLQPISSSASLSSTPTPTNSTNTHKSNNVVSSLSQLISSSPSSISTQATSHSVHPTTSSRRQLQSSSKLPSTTNNPTSDPSATTPASSSSSSSTIPISSQPVSNSNIYPIQTTPFKAFPSNPFIRESTNQNIRGSLSRSMPLVSVPLKSTTPGGLQRHGITCSNNMVQQYLEELSRLLHPRTNGSGGVSSVPGSSISGGSEHNKISKAALLHKAADQLKLLRSDKYRLQADIQQIHAEIEALQTRFSVFCAQLPATGVCVLNPSRTQNDGRIWFDEFVIQQSKLNWKFYIFCMIFESLFTSYNQAVSTNSMESLAHSVASWLEKECSLMKLRLIVMNGMRSLSRRTSIVHHPHRVPDDIRNLINSNQLLPGVPSLQTQTTTHSSQMSHPTPTEFVWMHSPTPPLPPPPPPATRQTHTYNKNMDSSDLNNNTIHHQHHHNQHRHSSTSHKAQKSSAMSHQYHHNNMLINNYRHTNHNANTKG